MWGSRSSESISSPRKSERLAPVSSQASMLANALAALLATRTLLSSRPALEP